MSDSLTQTAQAKEALVDVVSGRAGLMAAADHQALPKVIALIDALIAAVLADQHHELMQFYAERGLVYRGKATRIPISENRPENAIASSAETPAQSIDWHTITREAYDALPRDAWRAKGGAKA